MTGVSPITLDDVTPVFLMRLVAAMFRAGKVIAFNQSRFAISRYLWYILTMEYALKERIGKPDLFTGRKDELAYFLKWIDNIKEEKSQSTALLARRKMGKTALMERLFNITFYKNDGVIPFFYEIKENKMWVVDFCKDFFLTFIYQYIAFKSREPGYLQPESRSDFEEVAKIAKKEGLGYLVGIIKDAAHAAAHEEIDILWEIVRQAPQSIAFRQKEFIVQMIDEFQFLNAMIYLDKEKKNLADTLAGGYLSTAESKIAPLLVSGSWVGWLMKELSSMLPARFRNKFLKPMPENEAAETLYNYSRFFQVPVTDETAFLLTGLTEGNPFYISAVIRSHYPGKDLTTLEGVSRTLEFETLDNEGSIKLSWMEYISKAFPQINDRNAKNIVLHLTKHRDREFTRKEILDTLKLEMSDGQLEKKLKALVMVDIISQGRNDFRYRGVNDTIFDKVFRGVYQEEIDGFDVSIIAKEYRARFEELKKQYHRLLGEFNYRKGYFEEYLILDRLLFRAREDNELLKSVTRYLPGDFNFCEYTRVWRYNSTPGYGRGFSVDIYARAASPVDYSIIGEVKSRDSRKFSREEAEAFERKFDEVKRCEHLEKVVGFIFSRGGFTLEAENYCREKGIACSEDERWLA
ncbi:MAG: hypothetical protein QG657_3839 [Acidobacteriota bacterium]|nr:hypothetical protein [Acidobacteriota bacterium]